MALLWPLVMLGVASFGSRKVLQVIITLAFPGVDVLGNGRGELWLSPVCSVMLLRMAEVWCVSVQPDLV